MEHVSIQGEKVPALGFGTWRLSGKECRKAVKDAVELGYRHIDTAQIYDNEARVGEGIADSGVRREDIWLTTKLWRNNLNRARLKESFKKSLEKLGTDYVDLLLIHWPFDEMDLETVLEEMADLVEDGKVENIGISNFTPGGMERAQELSPVHIFANQVEYHPFLNQDAVLEKCREHGMMLTAYSPIARGKVLENDILQEIGRKYDKSPAQVALRWLIQQENVSAIPKAASAEHREANLEIFDFSLDSGEMERIHDLTSRNQREVDPDRMDWDS